MKCVLTAFMILLLSTSTVAQTYQQLRLEPTSQETSITKPQVSQLPVTKRSYRPKLTMQRALKLAEGYIKRQKIDVSRYYLYEAKHILYGRKDNPDPSWSFSWVSENGELGNYVNIIVSIESGNIMQLPSM